jgi:hypothetical protein
LATFVAAATGLATGLATFVAAATGFAAVLDAGLATVRVAVLAGALGDLTAALTRRAALVAGTDRFAREDGESLLACCLLDTTEDLSRSCAPDTGPGRRIFDAAVRGTRK